jgi:uncharacterized UPF0160 family protein
LFSIQYSFHADEVLAIVLLKFLPEYANHTVVRTRDADVLKTCHTVVDVGGVYDHATLRYVRPFLQRSEINTE